MLRFGLRAPLGHSSAVVVMVVATLLWATAGALARQISQARGFEITFWRSLLACASMLLVLRLWRGAGFLHRICWREPALWLSGCCWAVMFTAFMMAMSFTTVANVLVMSALGPVFTALASRLLLQHRLPRRTWVAIGVAALGVFYIYAMQLSLGNTRKLTGSLIALLVPMAGCVQWTLMQREQLRASQQPRLAVARSMADPDDRDGMVLAAAEMPEPVPARDMLPALVIGSALSALVCLPFALPFHASVADMGWLALLGMFQLAIPCSMAVVASRVLQAPELSLLALLEVIFGILLTWWGAGEIPSANTTIGGALVIGALAINELLGWRQRA